MTISRAFLVSLAMGPFCLLATAERMPSLRGSAATTYLKQQGSYNSLGDAVQAAMYGVRPDRLGFAAANPRQDFVAHFSERGLEVDGAGWQSSWRLRSVGYGERQVAVGPAQLEADGTRVELRRGAGVTEWYVNGAHGLEQGFTLGRPSGQRHAGEQLRLTMEVAGDLAARASGDALELVRADGSVALGYGHLVVKDARGRKLEARMGVADGTVWVEMDDANAAWPVTVDPTFAQEAFLKASNTERNDLFGVSVAVSVDTAVVGAFVEDSGATGVNGDQNNANAIDSGAAYVFVRNGVTWSQQAYLKASNTGAGDQFGRSVAVSGDTILIGAPLEDSNATGVGGNQADNSAIDSGAAYIFVRAGSTWSQQAYLKASNTGAGDEFGYTAAAWGDAVVVGAPFESSSATGVNGDQASNSAVSSGAAYMFVRNGVAWSQQAYLKASNTGAGDNFGIAVAVWGDTLLVGAYLEDSNATGVNGNQSNKTAPNAGAAYVFVRNGVMWSQQAYLKASNSRTGDSFGYAVALAGDTVVVGAFGESSSATGVNGNQANPSGALTSGAAYVFVRNGVTWSQQAYLKASNTGAGDNFGAAVAVSGDTIVVGAFGEGSSASGVNVDQNNDSAPNSGAAYVFGRIGTTWSQQAYLKASNTGGNDQFALVVALSGDTVLVGAHSESSNATGVNGDQSNNLAPEAGAAYVFHDSAVRITDIRSITDFGDVATFTSGSWLQIKGINLAPTTRIWLESDFSGDNAPTNLDGVSVTFNGILGFMYFTKPDDDFGQSQINVQAPAGLADGPVNVVVLNHFETSNTFVIQKTPLAPGLLSPAKFTVGGKPYLVATYGADNIFVGNENLLPGATFRPAKPGDILYVYGVGFGDVTPSVPPGVIPRPLLPLVAQVKLQFGPALVTPYFAGFYPNFIGLDLIALVVPDVPDGDHQITVLVNGQPLAQTLFLTVKR